MTMTSPLLSLSPAEVQRRLASDTAVLIDIREPDEFARRHIPGAFSRPLSGWSAANLPSSSDQDVIFACRSGMRTNSACHQLAARIPGPAYVLEGGIDAWDKAGQPLVENRSAPLEIMRQVHIAAGLLILLGIIGGFFLNPVLFGLSAFVGAGLTFAGVTGFCGMARLLMLAPWNRASVA
jgi:rhodanese-related sulfurtransferase